MAFKFEIGQIVTTKSAVEECRIAEKIGDARIPLFGMITDRRSHECSGGTQISYCTRIGNSEQRLYNEIELMPIDDVYMQQFSDSFPKWGKTFNRDADAFECLQFAKELFVAELNFPAAAKVCDLIDELRKEKEAKPTEPTA